MFTGEPFAFVRFSDIYLCTPYAMPHKPLGLSCYFHALSTRSPNIAQCSDRSLFIITGLLSVTRFWIPPVRNIMSSQPRHDIVYGPYPLPHRAMPLNGHQTLVDHYANYHEQYAPPDTMTGYGGHPGARRTTHEPSSDNGHVGSGRKRIQVAVRKVRPVECFLQTIDFK
nr:hypothetical protein CFP56_07686 [Quercus suber]